MPPHCLPESRSQALTGLAPHTPPPPRMPTQLPHSLVQTCVSSYSVLSLCTLESSQVAMTKLGQACGSAAHRLAIQSLPAQLCLLALLGGSRALGHVLIAAMCAPDPGFPD
ncbi:unnamed protein product [Rangifer tarandus platyrhynchus]|uniref:Uncharacterized protein n=2 Tax=Rangifer tarandus platyrhynchus TaxID=3082113 RepID=A0AC59Y879_RANTA|nr:unnamed protein product [Rangifer tarandus platyrhynchus]